MLEHIERDLDSFDPKKRKDSLELLARKLEAGEIQATVAGTDVNLHCHSFFSFNAYGYSPSHFAWRARQRGLGAAGVVDFDVLDGLEEFYAAGERLNLKSVVGMETRVFIPEFASRVINSPGEPGVSYHMGVGFPSSNLKGKLGDFLAGLKQTAQERNRSLIARVNTYLAQVAIDYEKDVLPLTPAGNATERHICTAYARKARQVFADDAALLAYWGEKLGANLTAADLPEGKNLTNAIRAKTMKQGGVGYVQPDAGSFPKLVETNNFIQAAGGIPTFTWLDGTSEGERAIEELLEVSIEAGAAAVNIIPDRNYTPSVKDQKLANLYHFVELAQARNLPVVVGTEMNAPGNKFVDSFATAELAPLVPVFLRGAWIVYAHAMLQRRLGFGYGSEWAKQHFASAVEKNEFYAEVGEKLEPKNVGKLDGLKKPGEIIKRVNS